VTSRIPDRVPFLHFLILYLFSTTYFPPSFSLIGRLFLTESVPNRRPCTFVPTPPPTPSWMRAITRFVILTSPPSPPPPQHIPRREEATQFNVRLWSLFLLPDWLPPDLWLHLNHFPSEKENRMRYLRPFPFCRPLPPPSTSPGMTTSICVLFVKGTTFLSRG